MKRLLASLLLLLSLPPCQAADKGKPKHVVLPNTKLLRCKAADCFQLWSENSSDADGIFPKQMIIDMDQNCLYGMTAVYDKSISVDDLKAVIDASFAEWGFGDPANPTMKLWRVTPDKFAIQLTVASKNDEKRNVADAGTKQVIFLAFGAKTACGGQ
jgi:hypothetical protein